MTTKSLYSYACECGARHCGATIEMPREEWERLARKGAVVHESCANGRPAIVAWGEARAVRSTMLRGLRCHW